MRYPLLLALSGCAPAHRVGKFFAPVDYVVPAQPRALAAVTYASGWVDEPPRAYDPEPFHPKDGGDYERAVPITVDGWVEVAPLAEGVRTEVWVRHVGLDERDFRPVATVTGALPGSLPNALRFLPQEGRVRVYLADLANAYAGEPVEDGDLVLLALREGDRTEQYVFRARDFGLRARFGADVLVRIPLSGDEELSPALAATAAFGYRPRTRRSGVEWLFEQVAVVTSAGIGSTALETDESLSGAFNAGLVGGGLQLFDFVSGQLLVNLSSLLREDEEQNLAFAVGFDAIQFGRFTQRAGKRLLRRNELVTPE